MTCGQLQVQICSHIWVSSTVHLVGTVQAKGAEFKRTTKAAYNLVIDRPRIVGGTLTIPLDSTVKVVRSLNKDIAYNIIRLAYGSRGKSLILRASSSRSREHWLASITPFLQSEKHIIQGSAQNAAKMFSNPQEPQFHRSNDGIGARTGHAMHHAVNSVSASAQRAKSSIPKTSESRSAAFKHDTATFSQPSKISPGHPLKCSRRRVFRQNVPALIQLFITVGQAVAAAS